jgi:uncharacterized protein YxeA
MRQLNPDTSSKFLRIRLSSDDEQLALQVSPLFLAYLQNKIAAYAEEQLEKELPYDADPTQQVKAILQYERNKHFIEAFEELMAEIMDAQASNHHPQSNTE